MTERHEVDGTTPGVAISVIVRFEPAWPIVISADRYEETDFPDPHATAWAIWESVKNDWPGAAHMVQLNPRANFIRWQRLMESLELEGGVDLYLETEA